MVTEYPQASAYHLAAIITAAFVGDLWEEILLNEPENPFHFAVWS